MKSIFSLLLLCTLSFGYAQNNTIDSGEKLVFTASYNMSGLMTDLAEVTMETSTVNTSTSSLLRLKCSAATYSKWDGFFKIRDLYESYVNPKTLTPYLYKRDINEGGYIKFMQYKYNHSNNTIKSKMVKRRRDGTDWEVNNSFSIGGSTKDIVSTIYYIRNLDIHKASPGASDSFTVVFDEKEVICTFTYIGKETINTAIGKKECYKLAINVKGTNVLKGSNSNLLWLTADENKIPVYGKFRVAVGSGELKIKSATGLKH